MAVTSGQAHYLTFPVAVDKPQISSSSLSAQGPVALPSDFAAIATLSYSFKGLQLYSSTVVLFKDVPRIVNVSTAMYDARWFWVKYIFAISNGKAA